MIAVSGLDMAAWDALAKAADMPLAVFLGGSLGAGAGLQQQRAVADRRRRARRRGARARRRRRLQRAQAATRPRAAGRRSRGDRRRCVPRSATDIKLMVDFNQGLSLGDALHRCHALDEQGLYWFEEPIAYNNLAGLCAARARAEDADPARRELLRAARAVSGAGDGRRRLRDAGPDADRRRHRLAARRGDRRRRRHRDVDASLSGILRASDARDRDRALARMAGLGRSDPGRAVRRSRAAS